jgi:cAMP-dependent protein kinase regulator
MPSGLLLTGRLLADLGRLEGGARSARVCVARDRRGAVAPAAACSDLRTLGEDAGKHFDAIADAFAAGSPRLGEGGGHPPKLPHADEFHPLASVLTGLALLGKTTELVHTAKRVLDQELSSRAEPPVIAPQPLFSSIARAGLRAMIEVFEVSTVPQGTIVIEEGTGGAEAYIVARGELEVRREREATSFSWPRLTGGALSRVALLSRAPGRRASACRPSILRSVARTRSTPWPSASLRSPSSWRPTAAAAWCKPRAHEPDPVGGAGRRAAALVERFETRVYEGRKAHLRGQLHGASSHRVGRGGGRSPRGDEPFVLATLSARATSWAKWLWCCVGLLR